MYDLILNIIPYTVFFIALCYAAYTDVKTQKIKLWTFPVAAIISLPCVIANIVMQEYWSFFFDFLPLIMGAITGFGIFFFIALIGKGGGADAIMSGCIGLIFGISRLMEIFIVVIAIILLWTFYRFALNKAGKKKYNLRQPYPLAPFVLTGYIFVLVYYGLLYIF